MRKKILFLPLLGLISSTCLTSAFVQAADKALLFGVAEYQDKRVGDLPGNKHDIEMMEKVAQKMGFLPENTKVLLNDKAKKKNIENALRFWIRESVGPNDRILIYYTGHGTRLRDTSGDEEDGMDEGIVPYDAKKESGREDTLLIDDEIGELLADIPSDHVFVIFDSCFSGTATKSIGFIPKFSPWPGVKGKAKHTGHTSKASISVEEDFGKNGRQSNIAFLAASHDWEEAAATENGSFFTLGIWQTINEAADRITLADLERGAASFISSSGGDHNPQLTDGKPSLANINLLEISFIDDQFAKYRKLVRRFSPKRLVLQPDKNSYRLGKCLMLTLDLPASGYLNVLTISEGESRPTILFPNDYAQESAVKKGKFILPQDAGKFELRAQSPGKTLLFAFLTREKLNLYKNGSDKGNIFNTLNKAGKETLRSFGVERNDISHASGEVVVTIAP